MSADLDDGRAIDAFAQGYLAAMLAPINGRVGLMAPEALAQALADCEAFKGGWPHANDRAALLAHIEAAIYAIKADANSAGAAFFRARNGDTAGMLPALIATAVCFRPCQAKENETGEIILTFL